MHCIFIQEFLTWDKWLKKKMVKILMWIVWWWKYLLLIIKLRYKEVGQYYHHINGIRWCSFVCLKIKKKFISGWIFEWKERQSQDAIKRNCLIYGFVTLELNLASTWQHCIWLTIRLFDSGYFKSLRISFLGPNNCSMLSTISFPQNCTWFLQNS